MADDEGEDEAKGVVVAFLPGVGDVHVQDPVWHDRLLEGRVGVAVDGVRHEGGFLRPVMGNGNGVAEFFDFDEELCVGGIGVVEFDEVRTIRERF